VFITNKCIRRLILKIGIPRALLYYIYYPLWKTFIEELGHEVILSSGTNQSILDNSVKNSVDDACLPVKLFHGHVMDLIGKVDRILVPRLVSVHPGEYICPKFIGLPEMIKNSVPGKPNLIILDYNARNGIKKGINGFRMLGRELGASKIAIHHALELAHKKQEVYGSMLLEGANPVALLEKKVQPVRGKPKGRIGLIGHPYLIYDQYINMNICSKLAAKGYIPYFPENILPDKIEKACERYPKKLFWSYGKSLLGSGLTMMEDKMISGMILLTSFGCGIDSFIDELLQIANQREFRIPLTLITLDEHTGHAGFDTRLEAFIDMLEWRSRNDYYISPYGAHVYSGQRTV
jgi:predicted nucleotide-binding protein (sugar kinase/HSP70/actin superfamily)